MRRPISSLLSGGVLRLAASHGFGRDFLDFFAVVRGEGESACGAALSTRASVIVEDIRISPVFAGKPSLEAMLDAGSLSVVSMPIVSRASGVLGMVSTHRRSVGRPNPAELNRLAWLARQTAEILEGSGSPFSIRSVGIVARGRRTPLRRDRIH